jgi:hypothetical protein
MADSDYQLFVSYAAEDREFVEKRLLPGLRRPGIRVFYDRDLPHGQALHSIFDELARANEVLVLMTYAAIESFWVLAEIGGALTTRKTLIPICYGPTIEELRNRGLSELLGSPNYLNWSDREWIKYLADLDLRSQTNRRRKPRRQS